MFRNIVKYQFKTTRFHLSFSREFCYVNIQTMMILLSGLDSQIRVYAMLINSNLIFQNTSSTRSKKFDQVLYFTSICLCHSSNILRSEYTISLAPPNPHRNSPSNLFLSQSNFFLLFSFRFLLGHCVIGSHNTSFGDETTIKKYPRPFIYGVAVNLESGEIFPAEFLNKYPDEDLRHVRLSFRQFETYEEYESMSGMLYQDFDTQSGKFVIQPFNFVQSPDLPFIAKAGDKYILGNMSTSPNVEPRHFCSSIRSACRLVLDHPDPHKTIFQNGQPRSYAYSPNDKKWIRLKQ